MMKALMRPKWDKMFEKDFLIDADIRCIPVSVISSGIKKRIEEHYVKHLTSCITVVTNGTRIPCEKTLLGSEIINIKEQYNLAEDTKICVNIGMINENKNQIQIIEAIKEFPIKFRKKTAFFLCGEDSLNGFVQKKVDEYKLNKQVYFLGFVPHDKVINILKKVDLNIVASKDEGFGLPIIEAFSCGVPSVTFLDLNAVEDLYSDDSMVLSRSRSTNSLTFAIKEALERKWDKEVILDHAKKFSLEHMAEKYTALYAKVVEENKKKAKA